MRERVSHTEFGVKGTAGRPHIGFNGDVRARVTGLPSSIRLEDDLLGRQLVQHEREKANLLAGLAGPVPATLGR